MGILVETRTTPASPDAVWAILDDFGNISQYSSGVASSEIINDIETGVGAERLCKFDAAGKQWVKERLEERTDDGVRINIYDSNAPFKSLVAHIQVEPRVDGAQITMTMDMVVKGGPLGKVMEVLMIKPSFRKALKALLADIDQHARTTTVAA